MPFQERKKDIKGTFRFFKRRFGVNAAGVAPGIGGGLANINS